MAKTLAQIRAQIEQLEIKAAAVQAKEVTGVIARIQEAISFYGLTASDLFGGKTAKSTVADKTSTKTRATKTKKQPSPPKYRDPSSDKTWNGHGKRPGWYVQAIASGKKPEELRIQP